MNKYHFKITENDAKALKSHLHNGDGLEAIAFALCGRFFHEKTHYLYVHKLILHPYNKCSRTRNSVNWTTEDLTPVLEEALLNNFGIVKFHSHPQINSSFSELDDISDKGFFESVYAWLDNDLPHGSLIMYSDGSFKGRIIDSELNFKNLDFISVIGNTISKISSRQLLLDEDELTTHDRTLQAFGSKTVGMFRDLKIGVVGCSGTGSPTIEQLYRLGVGELFIVDPKILKDYNLNRILGTSKDHVKNKVFKVEAIRDNIIASGLDTKVKISKESLQESRETLNELSSCDIIIGCVDSAEGRYYMNLISTYYLIPLIDIGVKLSADGKGGIDSINGNIHYVYPGSKSLMERKVFNSKQLEGEELSRTSPEEYTKRQVYFDNIENEVSPAVISVNMLCSSLAVNELLGRIHPYRFEANEEYSITRVNLTNWEIMHEKCTITNSKLFKDSIGVGNKEPLINLS